MPYKKPRILVGSGRLIGVLSPVEGDTSPIPGFRSRLTTRLEDATCPFFTSR